MRKLLSEISFKWNMFHYKLFHQFFPALSYLYNIQWNLTINVTHGTGQKWPWCRGDLITGGYLHCGMQFFLGPSQGDCNWEVFLLVRFHYWTQQDISSSWNKFHLKEIIIIIIININCSLPRPPILYFLLLNSICSHIPMDLNRGVPLGLSASTVRLSTYSVGSCSPLLLTCPYHFSDLLMRYVSTGMTLPLLSHSCTHILLYVRLTPSTRRNILISVLHGRFCFVFLIVQVSAPIHYSGSNCCFINLVLEFHGHLLNISLPRSPPIFSMPVISIQ